MCAACSPSVSRLAALSPSVSRLAALYEVLPAKLKRNVRAFLFALTRFHAHHSLAADLAAYIAPFVYPTQWVPFLLDRGEALKRQLNSSIKQAVVKAVDDFLVKCFYDRTLNTAVSETFVKIAPFLHLRKDSSTFELNVLHKDWRLFVAEALDSGLRGELGRRGYDATKCTIEVFAYMELDKPDLYSTLPEKDKKKGKKEKKAKREERRRIKSGALALEDALKYRGKYEMRPFNSRTFAKFKFERANVEEGVMVCLKLDATCFVAD
eukprot:Hpha_TRINITY_DN12109_c0_g1::TRINITY_DN12109_c0_g1_i1::g.81834::m.81834